MSQEEKVLPLLQQQRYKTFQQTVEQVQQIAVLPDASSLALRSGVTALQQAFHDQLNLPMDELSAATQQWLQSYQVEIDKQLRLLGIDILFLQAAKQANTAAQRRQQVCDRLNLLQRYCEALLVEESEG